MQVTSMVYASSHAQFNGKPLNQKEKKLFLQEIQQKYPAAKVPVGTILFVKEDAWYIVSDTIKELLEQSLRIKSLGLQCAIRKHKQIELTEQGKYLFLSNPSP